MATFCEASIKVGDDVHFERCQLGGEFVGATTPQPAMVASTPIATTSVASVSEQPTGVAPPAALAFTGANTEILGSIGLMLVAIGIGMRQFARRITQG